MASEKSVYNFAAEKSGKRKKPKTQLDYDMQRCQELGYGPHYGKYRADHPSTRAEFEAATAKKTPPKLLTCANCGAEFIKNKNANQKYCSPECKEIAHARQVKRSKNNRPQPGTVRTCPICGKEFVSYGGRKYCTLECRQKGDRLTAARLREKYRQEAKKHGNA